MTEPDSFRPLAPGFSGAVVAGHPAVALVGLDTLRNGGNAVDAGVAMGMAMTVVLGHECSFFGVAPTLLYLADRGDVVHLDGTGVWSKQISLDMFGAKQGAAHHPDILHTLTPGTPDAWITALRRFGTLSFAQAAAPAVALAEHGFPMYGYLARILASQQANYRRWPGTSGVFLPAGRVPSVGERFIQKDLAATFRRIAAVEERFRPKERDLALRAARDFIYKGDLARQYVEYCKLLGGVLSIDDMAGYEGRSEAPASVGYRGFQVYCTGVFGQGPVFPQALKILEGFDLRAMGHNSAEYIHTVSQALNLSFADREKHMGDPLFTDAPLDALLADRYLAARRDLIDPERAWPEMPPAGDPLNCNPMPGPPRSAGDPSTAKPMRGRSETGTAYFGAMDQSGNIFSCTASDGARTCPIIPGIGMALSLRGNQCKLEPGHPATPGPGKRPRLTPSPALVLKDGKPFMALGGFGGDKMPQATLQIFLNAVEFGLTPQAAVEQPRFYSFNFPSSSYPPTYLPGVLRAEARISPETLDGLRARGHRIEMLPAWWEGACLYGMIRLDPATGAFQAGADPRGGASALAY